MDKQIPLYVVTGAGGQLGRELADSVARDGAASDQNKIRFLFADRKTLDIGSEEEAKTFFSQNEPAGIINCAAYTAVDKAQSEPAIADQVNAYGPQLLAECCQQYGSLLIHVSTDFVFDGKAVQPYDTDHAISPLGVYGMSKAEGELRALTANHRSIIVRTSWLYSAYGANFVKTMLRLGAEKQSLNVVNDQVGSPTYARDLADALLRIALTDAGLAGRGDGLTGSDFGVYHYCNTGSTSWCGFAKKIMEMGNLPCRVNPIPTVEYPTPATRPAYSVLNSSRISDRFDLQIPSWENSLIEYLNLQLKN